MVDKEGYIDVPGGKVWYLRVGKSEKTPLLVLHGGPGNTHDPLRYALGSLGCDRPVIFYDQLGSGNSERPTDLTLWTMERFVEELAIVRDALDLKELHILGHSWGTMLAASYLIERGSDGVRSTIFSSPCLSAKLWKKDADRLIEELPVDLRRLIFRHEEQGTTDSQEYREAMNAYYARHVCRLDSLPTVVASSRSKANKEIYMTMWGPSEFCPTGNLKSYDCTPKLPVISVPSLFLCGRYDEATPESTAYYRSLLPGAALHIFEHSSHMSYLEETEAYVNVVNEFLNKVESKEA